MIATLLLTLNTKAEKIYPNSEPSAHDDFKVFLQNLNYTVNISWMQAQGLTKGQSGFEPWSGSYWPIHKGILSFRYASPNSTKSKNFIENYQNYSLNPALTFINTGRINELSPAEKYDLLIGDSNWTLSHFMWEKGLRDYQTEGSVATWTGICHGWAAVTHMIPTSPHSPVTLKDVSGQHSITFHAHDIKGLMSWLWATSSPRSHRAGDRCRQDIVDRDSYLRPLEPSCLDSNPMSWHLAIVNKVGLNNRSFVMDSSNGTEVWNYPITGYDYHYFDPKTFIPTHNLNSAIRSLSDLKSDPFKSFRSPRAQYIVGITMDTFHPALTEPTIGITSFIRTKKMTFVYDLELDENYNVVGGEWYAKKTPDFIWSFQDGAQAFSREDAKLRSQEIIWKAQDGMMTSEIAQQARSASARGFVLATITNALLNASALASKPPTEDGMADEEEIETNETAIQ